MSDRLNVIALISGGKDSLYSLLHCVQHGHAVVALANLHPPLSASPSHGIPNTSDIVSAETEAGDMNSFMYQTVGHSVIPLYAKALDIPLYRREITGSAIVTDRYYAYTMSDDYSLDETEDLVPLLQSVMKAHPTANAISTGAIQSTYQRTRIESIALRLGLIPLAYLWQYPLLPSPTLRDDTTTGLLEDMAAAGCEARIIKIASGGIGEKLLWANVTSPKTMQGLIKGLTPFFFDDEAGLRGAVVGEGGEYETLALSGPRAVWKVGVIVADVNQESTVLGEGGTSYVRFSGARLVPHTTTFTETDMGRTHDLVTVPPLFDPLFAAVRDESISAAGVRSRSTSDSVTIRSTTQSRFDHGPFKLLYTRSRDSIHIANISCAHARTSHNHEDSLSISEQMNIISTHLRDVLGLASATLSISPPLDTTSIVHSTLLLRSIDTFSEVNQFYASLFSPGTPNPPARVTIAVPLPNGVDISMSVTIALGPRQKNRGLHVQSRSYWAPANIGPYSQAINVPLSGLDDCNVPGSTNKAALEVCHVAGQIPLVPSTMNNLQSSFVDQALLSLQHLWRVGQEQQTDYWAFGVAYLAEPLKSNAAETEDRSTMETRVDVVADAWARVHHASLLAIKDDNGNDSGSSEDEVDVWHLQHNRGSSQNARRKPTSQGAHVHQLPLKHSAVTHLPPFIAARVSALPRYAPIEWWSLGIARLKSLVTTSTTAVIDFNNELAEDYIFTVITIAMRIKIITYMVKRGHKQSQETRGPAPAFATIRQLLEHGLQPAEGRSFQLVSGIAFVDINAGYNVNSFGLQSSKQTSNEQKLSTASAPDISQSMTSQDSLLGEAVSVVPCHDIWGHGGRSDTLSTIENSGPVVEQIDVAFIFRFDAF